MTKVEQVMHFIQDPFPLWEQCLTGQLVQIVDIGRPGTAILTPRFDELSFFEAHGLTPMTADELISEQYEAKIAAAMAMLSWVPEVEPCITQLVRLIYPVRSEDNEIDVSYSHPDVLATIFVSVCQQNDIVSQLRLAESILHEAMHLKLSLIERIVPLVLPFSGNYYDSPWRKEKRPAQGVLHGLFVFRAIRDYLGQLLPQLPAGEALTHAQGRIAGIGEEIFGLKDFVDCPDLTTAGAILVANLWPSS